MNDRLYKVLEFDRIKEMLGELTSSPMSLKMAEELVPETDRDRVIYNITETDDAVALIVKRGRPPLGGIVDVNQAIIRAAGGSMLSFAELLAVAGVLKAARRTLNYCGEEKDREDASSNCILDKIVMLREDYFLESEITRCIISEDEMADEASPELSDIRRRILREQTSIRDKLNEFIRSSKYAKAIQDEVITMRGDRYCIPVKAEFRSEFPGMVHDMSGSGQTLFIEPQAVVESNNKIRELRIKERQEIERITLLLGSLCAEKGELIRTDVTLLAKIDFAFAKASLAIKMKAQKPEIRENGYVNIVKGRHPLIEPHKVVPISVYIGDRFRTLVITGPNTGGKTVTLKTVGLFTLMMQSGLLVPCESKSVLSIFEDVFADIGDEQSIAQSLSTFSAHMSNIVRIMDGAGERTLVLLDELGAGTDPTEGAALAMAILETLYQMGAITMATTHYSELKAFTVQTAGFENASCEFDVETLSPTYRLMIGIPGKSNAFAISQKLGLDPQIVARAAEFLTSEDLRFEDLLQDIERRRGDIERKQQEIAALTEEAERVRREIGVEKEKLSEQRNQYLRKARDEAAEVILKAKKESERMLSELRQIARDAEDARDKMRAGEAIGRELSKMAGDAETERYDLKKKTESRPVPGEQVDADTPLEPGQTLYSRSLDGAVTVIKPQDKNGNVYVSAGLIKMFLDVSDLTVTEDPKDKAGAAKGGRNASGSAAGSGASGTMKALSLSPELDLRGFTADEALAMTDRYIDDAIQCHLETVTIIHGKGTGVLRREIQNMLKRDRRVKEFRGGEFGEGDYGVTIAKLKV